MKRFIIILLVLAVIGGGGYTLYARQAQARAETILDGYVTAPVAIADIEATISATGSLRVDRTQQLGFDAGGKVVEVLVAQGDHVEAGQVLARLDDRDVRLSVSQAEAALAVSEAQLARALKAPSEEELAAAEAALASAKASLAALNDGPSARDIALAKLQIDQAKNSLYGAQGNRDAIAGSPMASGGQKAQAEAQVLNAEVAVTIAETQYQKMFEKPKPSAFASAQAQVTQAESALAQLRSRPSAEDVAVAEAQVAQARVSVQVAQRRLDDLTLVAPYGGHLATWDVLPGDTATPGRAVGSLLSDGYELRVAIDETEIARVVIGQPVRVTLDAYPDVPSGGAVRSIALVGANSQGIVTYDVTIALDETDLVLRPAMTAAVDIVTERKADVLVVSNRAIRRDREGKFVEVLDVSGPQRINIETGIADDLNTEVLSGLTQGQPVIVSRPRDTNLLGSGPFGGS
jgi:HlyD family secretion protein